ncbi:MAG TPA: serine hydrolase [Candidatus Paceibacterota bacterium]|jgi:beta-lactamase class A|nr:serine hydrolase [Candidatus Paceibacterota bacterium]
MKALRETWAAARRALRRPLALAAIIGVVLFIAGLLIGTRISPAGVLQSYTAVRAVDNQYQLIDPVLYLSVPENASFPLYTPLKSAVTAYANAAVANGQVTQVSVYYRDLNSNRWIGVNPDDTFWPASMLKVIVLMSALHASETSPQILDQQITLPASLDAADSEQDFFPPSDPALPGKSYSVDTLLQKMIAESDNNANTALNAYLGSATVNKTFADLYVPIPDPNTGAGITAQQYSHLFRVLYNATYLSPADSERALQMLTQTTFTQGLVAGVPPGTTVAHKFGETTRSATSTSAAELHELHDCGIVYYPNNPYFICVMTRGTQYAALTDVIQGMSRTVWQQVDALHKETKTDPESGFL